MTDSPGFCAARCLLEGSGTRPFSTREPTSATSARRLQERGILSVYVKLLDRRVLIIRRGRDGAGCLVAAVCATGIARVWPVVRRFEAVPGRTDGNGAGRTVGLAGDAVNERWMVLAISDHLTVAADTVGVSGRGQSSRQESAEDQEG